jgi:aldose 1-epimerase
MKRFANGLAGAVGLTTLMAGVPALAAGAHSTSLSVNVEPFGRMPDGKAVQMYRLENASGMEVDIITYGGAVQSIKVPDKNGHIADVALGFDSLKDYLGTDTFFGALIGRYGNRIAKAKFTLAGKT